MHPPIPDLTELIRLFYETPADLGDFAPVAADELPDPYRGLLAHDQHMTVTVERFHGCLVDVRVIEYKSSPPHYARKILLTRQSDGAVVLFGIVRIDLDQVDPATRDEILARRKPLGRILIEHNVLREVELVDLWRVTPAAELRQLFAGSESAQTTSASTYGRTALIHCNGRPAVELLEIVAPAESATSLS
ncbi:MAG: hypothetical protein WD875_09235 [Pirellulales bacterium]